MSVAWINIEIDDLRSTKVSSLVDAYQEAALGDGQDDPLPGIITNVCTRIRAEIRSGGQINVSETPDAIPPSLKSLALRLVVWEAQSRINVFNSVPMTDQDNTDHRDDLDYLKRIADGKVTVETPDDPAASSEVQAGGQTPSITTDRRECLNRRKGL